MRRVTILKSRNLIGRPSLSGKKPLVSQGSHPIRQPHNAKERCNLHRRFCRKRGAAKMVMKIKLRWYEKNNDDLKENECSVDIHDADSSFDALGLSEETEIYADVFNVLPNWISILQPYFQHEIQPNLFDYQISFRYQGAWPPPPKQPRKES